MSASDRPWPGQPPGCRSPGSRTLKSPRPPRPILRPPGPHCAPRPGQPHRGKTTRGRWHGFTKPAQFEFPSRHVESKLDSGYYPLESGCGPSGIKSSRCTAIARQTHGCIGLLTLTPPDLFLWHGAFLGISAHAHGTM